MRSGQWLSETRKTEKSSPSSNKDSEFFNTTIVCGTPEIPTETLVNKNVPCTKDRDNPQDVDGSTLIHWRVGVSRPHSQENFRLQNDVSVFVRETNSRERIPKRKQWSHPDTRKRLLNGSSVTGYELPNHNGRHVVFCVDGRNTLTLGSQSRRFH